MAIAHEGYPSLTETSDWQTKIPIAHLHTFGEMLVEAYEPEGAKAPARSADGNLSVEIEALWGAGASGGMFRNRSLKHYFGPPSLEQREQYRTARMGQRRIAGNTRRGAPVILSPIQPLAAQTLIALYDELIVGVEGYSVNGLPLGDQRAEIVRTMDAFHKFRAAEPLFAGVAGMKERRTA
ncbi:MAG: hypothetical protein WBQ94_18135 [Terracidiphilus sp.]